MDQNGLRPASTYFRVFLRLRRELGGLPGVNETIAPKAKWRHRRTYQRVRERIRALESAIGSKRFPKPLDTRIFAYHVG